MTTVVSGTSVVLVTTPGTGTVAVPALAVAVTIEAWGAGGAGGFGPTSIFSYATGGGGGAYARTDALPVTPGGTIHYSLGAGGPRPLIGNNGAAGGDTWVNVAANAAPATRDVGALAKGGAGGTQANPGGTSSATGAVGGQASASIGDVKFSGGNSGNTTDWAKTGGGGSGGPNGAGASSAAANRSESAGGAGNGGLAAGGTTSDDPAGSSAGASTADGGGGGGGDGNASTDNRDGGSPGGGGGGLDGNDNTHGAAGGNGQIRLTFLLRAPLIAPTVSNTYVVAFPPVHVRAFEWTWEDPIAVSRSLLTGRRFVSMAKRRRRVVTLAMSGLSRAGMGYLEALKDFLFGGGNLTRIRSPRNRLLAPSIPDALRRLDAHRIGPAGHEMPAHWGVQTADSTSIVTAGATLPASLVIEADTWSAVQVSGLPSNTLVGTPGEFIEVFNSASSTAVPEARRLSRFTYSNASGVAVARVTYPFTMTGITRAGFGAQDEGIFEALGMPRTTQPDGAEFDVTWEFREVFADEVAALIEVNPWL